MSVIQPESSHVDAAHQVTSVLPVPISRIVYSPGTRLPVSWFCPKSKLNRVQVKCEGWTVGVAVDCAVLEGVTSGCDEVGVAAGGGVPTTLTGVAVTTSLQMSVYMPMLSLAW